MKTNRSFMLVGDAEIFDANDKFKSIKVLWPRGSKMPTISGKWEKMKDGRILATYSPKELERCLEIFETLNT